jgi:putative DNA primase/helicase
MIETPQEAAKRLAQPILAKGYIPAALHKYTDGEGNALYWRIRAKHPTTGEKWIRPMKLNGQGYELAEPKFEAGKPLYALHRITKSSDAIVWITEGEQKADALNKLGLVATTSGGATSADGADWQPLKGRTVRIWPDNDDPGKAYAGEVAKSLIGLGCAVSCVDVDALGLGKGEDAIEWLAAHPTATRSDIEGLPIRPASPLATIQTIDTVELIDGASIKPEAVSWLWDGYLARGKLHVLAGAPGTGKTMIALALAATVSTGGRWPDGTRSEPGNVLIWSAEDDIADTLVPRLIAMGADMRRVKFVGHTSTCEGRAPFDPAQDMPILMRTVADAGDVKLLIVDPIVSAVAGDSHKNAEVRRGLQPLVDVGHKLGAAVLGISHFSKGTAGREVTERVTGSLAFGALARVVLAAAKRSDEDGGGRILARAKSNLGPDGGGFAYDLAPGTIEAHPGIAVHVLQWGSAIEGSARDLLATAEDVGDSEERSATDEAQSFLIDLLTTGPMKASEAQKEARQAGIADKPLRTARERLHVKPYRREFSGGWWWKLPTSQDAQIPQDAHVAQSEKQGIFDTKGHLGQQIATVEIEV